MMLKKVAALQALPVLLKLRQEYGMQPHGNAGWRKREELDLSGAAGGDRTHDPWLRRPILYPLSYSRVGGISEVMRRIPFFFTYVYGNCRIAGNCMSLLNFCAYNCGFHKGLHPSM
jgi:hypothetical protein